MSLYFTQKQGSLPWCLAHLGVVVFTERLNNHLKTLPYLAFRVRAYCIILGGTVRHGEGGLPLLHIREWNCTLKIFPREMSCLEQKSIKASVLHSEA